MPSSRAHREEQACIGRPLASAREWAARGIPILPLYGIDRQGCHCRGNTRGCKPGKHPRTAHGAKDASAEPLQLERWAREFPDSNYGICVGPDSGVLVLDLDPRNGHDLPRLEAELSALPETLTVLTGQYVGLRGRHLYFQCPRGLARSRVLAPGVELKASGYVVGPGSRHPSGVNYEVQPGCPDQPALLPASWTEYLSRQECSRPENAAGGLEDESGSGIQLPQCPSFPPFPPYQEYGGNGGASARPEPSHQERLSRIIDSWRGETIRPGGSLEALRRLGASLASADASLHEAVATCELIISNFVSSGCWRCRRTPQEFVEGAVAYFLSLPKGKALNALWLYRRETDYLRNLADSERHFVYLAICSQRLATNEGRSHFIWPLKVVASYLALVGCETRSYQQLIDRAKYLTSRTYNPQSRLYAGQGLSLFTGRIQGNHRQNPSYRGGSETANEYCFGADYALAEGELVSQTQAETELYLLPITPQLWQRLGKQRNAAELSDAEGEPINQRVETASSQLINFVRPRRLVGTR